MDPDANLLLREKLLRDSFTLAEKLLFALILSTANLAFWLADPRSYWLLGFFLIPAAMIFVLLKTHEYTHPFFITLLWPKFWLCTAPVWLLLLQFCVGLLQQPLHLIDWDGRELVQLELPRQSWLPVRISPGGTWRVALGMGSIHPVAVGLFIVPKSRAFFERLMPLLCGSAVLVALFGYLQKALETTRPVFTKGTGAEDFFAFFPYDGHWAAFAILWTCVCISMALLTTRYENSPPFVESAGPWYLTGGTLLGGSAFLVQARWPAVMLMLTCAGMLLLVSVHFLRVSKDPHRTTLGWLSGLVAAAMLASGLSRIFQAASQPEIGVHLRQAAWEMFRDRPLFGWGVDSFAHLLPFYGSDFLQTDNYQRVGSDALQLLTELGVVGLIPSLALLVVLCLRYMQGRCDIQLTNHLLLGIVATAILAFLDSPFMSPAVFYSFVIVLFVALRWADLTRKQADEVDAPPPTLVTPPSLRRVPFYTKQDNSY